MHFEKQVSSIESDTTSEAMTGHHHRRQLMRLMAPAKKRKDLATTYDDDENVEEASLSPEVGSDAEVADLAILDEVVTDLKRRMQQADEDHLEWMRVWLRKSRIAADQAAKMSPQGLEPGHQKSESPFRDLKRLKSKTSTEKISSGGVNVVKYSSTVSPVPYYTHYTTIEASVLSENLKTLMVYPNLTQDAEDDSVRNQAEADLQNEFRSAIPERRRPQLHNRTKTSLLQPLLLEFLIGCMKINGHDLLHALLDSKLPELSTVIKYTMLDLRSQPRASERRAATSDGFPLDISPSPEVAVILACFACVAISRVCKLDLYDTVVQLFSHTKAATVKPRMSLEQKSKAASSLVCRICFMSVIHYRNE